jgi:hypothetical protein
MLTTAGNVLFTANGRDVIAFNATIGKTLLHAGLLAAPSSGSALITYMLDGKQPLLFSRRFRAIPLLILS